MINCSAIIYNTNSFYGYNPICPNRTIMGKFNIKVVERAISINTKLVDSNLSGDGYSKWSFKTSINAPVVTILMINGILDYNSDTNSYNQNVTMTVSNSKDGNWTNEENFPYGDSSAPGAYTSSYEWKQYTLTIDGNKVEESVPFGYSGIENYTGSKEYVIGNFKYTVTFFPN